MRWLFLGKAWYALLVFAALHGSVVETGYAPHYAKNLMARVASNRGMEREACMISSPTLPLGSWIYLYGHRTGVLLHCKTVDVSHPRDQARHIRTRRIVEISFEVTVLLCGRTDERVIDCPITTVKL